MTAGLKLGAFATLLALVFGLTALIGGTVGPDRHRSGDSRQETSSGTHRAADSMSGMSAESNAGDHETSADMVRGLAVSDRGLTLSLARTKLVRGRAADLQFAIVGRDGQPVRDFEVEHERRMHFILVRRDGQGFQHLHPQMDADGTWRVRVKLPDAGSYRVFADFMRNDIAQTLAADIAVDGNARYRPLPAPANIAATGDGYQVRLDSGPVRAGQEANLRFTVFRHGQVVHTEPYLGAGGHLVALRQGDLAYLHVHPAEQSQESDTSSPSRDAVPFMTTFPSAGDYRLYLQFKHDARVHTAAFTLAVTR